MSDMLDVEAIGPGAPASATAGALLREARHAAGVHIAALAAALKVPVHKLEALEADRYDVFPDAVFVRGLASSVCRALKVDPAAVLAALPQGVVPRLSVNRGINASFKRGGTRASGGRSAVPRSVVAVVLVLLLAALAMVFVPRVHETPVPLVRSGQSESNSEVSSGAVPPPAGAASSSAPITAGTSVFAQPSVVTPAPSRVASQPSASSVIASEDLLVITARGTSWVQVRNLAGGTTQKTLGAGEKLIAPGAPPWTVVIGKADAATVMVRGQPLDIASFTRENVARFEVK